MGAGHSAAYDPRQFPPVAVTVDVVLFTVAGGALNLLLVERGMEPSIGQWALPGGFVRPEEDLEGTAIRELAEETGINEEAVYLEQLATYGDPDRDPRMRVVTVAYWGACARIPDPVGGGDAAHAELIPVSRVESGEIRLAFDHQQIALDALERLRAKLEYTAVAAKFCRAEFTISELRKVYQAVWNTRLDPGNFQRKVRDNRAFGKVLDTAGKVSGRSAMEDVPGEPASQAFQALPDVDTDRYGLQRVAPRAVPFASMSSPHVGRHDRETASGSVSGRLAMRPAPKRRTKKHVPSRGSKGGRPASLWSAPDPGLRLNSPFASRPPPIK